MKGDLPPAAFRLLNVLPVRTHIAPEPEARGYGRPGKGTRAETDRFGSKGIRFRGVEYASITEALRKLRVGYRTLCTWIDSGDASYL